MREIKWKNAIMIKIVRNGEKMEKNIYKYSMEIIGIDIPDKPLKICFKEEFENLWNSNTNIYELH